ncbi:hypothetical protein ACIBF5_09575 [Micromonospora sp. NPDC050417]|uniref:hypothetical protein n=1 Tax=Micromonospora sp. NPDC050417 TaxID=3364280 RepID=UPI0037AB50C7
MAERLQVIDVPRPQMQPLYEVTVITRVTGPGLLEETTTGSAATTAAWLRAKADEIDPPRRPTRGAGSGRVRGDGEALLGDRATP